MNLKPNHGSTESPDPTINENSQKVEPVTETKSSGFKSFVSIGGQSYQTALSSMIKNHPQKDFDQLDELKKSDMSDIIEKSERVDDSMQQ